MGQLVDPDQKASFLLLKRQQQENILFKNVEPVFNNPSIVLSNKSTAKNIKKQEILTIVVQEPLTLSALLSQITDFFKNSTSDLIKLILGAFATAFVAWFVNRITKKRQTDR